MTKRKIIIDCDPGQDDAVAILLALAATKELDILGITTIAGNVPLTLTEQNARRICELAGRSDMPVFAGASQPLFRKLVTAEWIHGKTGLDGADLPAPEMDLQEKHAVSYIVDTCLAADENSITICPIGPMTNVALAIMQAPQIIPKIKEIVFMGGAVQEFGNTTPAAEFNIYVDPHAANVVVESGIPIVMMPLDVTHKALVTESRLERFKHMQTPVGNVCGGMLDFFNRFDMGRYGFEGGPLHDPCVVAYLIEPDIFSGREVNLAIEISSELTIGQTVVDWWDIQDKPKNAFVCNDLDDDRFFELLFSRLGQL